MTFPDKTNRVYIESANFNVLDDSGYSTASITLADPEFYNLENLFIKALFLANSLTKGEGNWYCAMFWGWFYYGSEVGNPPGQRKSSGVHYYMLRDLTYDLTDVELRVTFELMDLGASAFSQNNENIKVGPLSAGNGVSNERVGSSTGTSGSGQGEGQTKYIPEKEIAKQGNAKMDGDSPFQWVGKEDYLDLEPKGGGASAAPSKDASSAPEQYQNVITGKTYWEIIQIICAAHKINAVARVIEKDPPDPPVPTDGPSPGEGGGTVMSPEYGRFVVAYDAVLMDTINDLLQKITNQPKDAAEDRPTFRWGMLAGGKVSKRQTSLNVQGQSDLDIAFGWIPQPPKSRQKLEDAYRLARVFTYRPGHKQEIAIGETMINSLRYEWSSKGFWNVGASPVYVTAFDEKGAPAAYITQDNYLQKDPKEKERIATDPTIKKIPLEQFAALKGVEIKLNFDTRTESEERITVAANAVIINVWNFFLRELINVSIDIPGDPWLDNHLFSPDGQNDNSDILVDLYHAYFKVKVYKLSPGSHIGQSTFLSQIISGNYLCLKGCSHQINDGDYTTSMQLMKAF
jgi:hypothetical protein